MGKKKRGPVGTKKGTLRIAPCIMIRDGGRYRIWVSEATMKGLLEVQSQLLLSSYDEVLSVLLASYKEISGRRHKAQSERLNDWCWNSPVQRTDSCEQSSSSTMQSATSFTVHREKSSKPAPVGIIGNKKATSKRERQLCETTSIVKEEYLEDTLTEQDPLQEGKSEDCRTESEGTLQKSGQPRELEGFFLEHGNLEDRQTPLLEDKSGDGRTERERSLQMSENPRGTSETSLDRESRLTGESRSTVLSTQNQQEGPDTSMKEEESEDDLSYADYDISDDGDDNHKNLVHPSNEGDSRSSTFLMKKEPEDDGSSGGGKANLHETSSCSQQGVNSTIQTTCGTKKTYQDVSGGTSHDISHGVHVPEEWILHGAQENYSDLSARASCSSEYDSELLPTQADYPQGHSATDADTMIDHDGGLDEDILMGCDVKGEIMSGDASCDRSHAQGLSATDSATASDHEEGNGTGPSDECRTTLSDIKQSSFCPVCNEKLTSSDDWTDHLRLHSELWPHECTFCNKRCATVKDLNRHMRVHPGARPHKCSICGRRFSEGYHLREHMAVHAAQKRYQCKFCERTYARRGSLYAHIKTHERTYQCKHCDMRFTHRIMLSEHTRSHHSLIKEKTFECSICHRKFARSADLIGHRIVHTGEKPFQCSQCGKTFSYKRVLVTHEKIHTGVKDHLCPICGRVFGRDYILQQHMLIHSGDLPYSCSVCSKKFRQKSTMVKHMKSQHPTLAT
ncbi:zinc finger protein 235-like isoform X2 [Lytechinus variegatus]|uniref:zinc finger protein 235-like isoform X2 n=1 Tax=Lytechinus variegatus TaxID=7654 RepID=UPI001BB1741E|nr:zinc finger protein 235-like isoform X2 [Lytechinus variegatus]